MTSHSSFSLKAWLLSVPGKILSSWDEFFFKEESLPQVIVMRLILGGTLFYMYLMRLLEPEFYSANGMVPKNLAPLLLPDPYRLSYPFQFWPDAWSVPLQIVFLLLLLVFTLGYLPRWLMVIAWYLNYAFFQRNYSICFGADVIGNIFLFCMMFIQPIPITGLKAIDHVKKSDWISKVGFRLIQIQLCVIYAYTGLEKMKGTTWWDGTAVWSVMANPQLASFDFSFLRFAPWLIPVGGYMSLLYEAYFPLLVLNPRTKVYTLAFGFLFHFGIGLFIGLGQFSAVMISAYFLFLNPSQFKTFCQSFQSIFNFAKNSLKKT